MPFRSYPPVPMNIYCQPDYTGSVGDGTAYPLALSLSQLMYLWWIVDYVQVTGNGTMFAKGDCPCLIRGPCGGTFSFTNEVKAGRSEEPKSMSFYICNGYTYDNSVQGILPETHGTCYDCNAVFCYSVNWHIALDGTKKIGDLYYPPCAGSVSICNPDTDCHPNGSCTPGSSSSSSSFSSSSSSSGSGCNPDYCPCAEATSIYNPEDPQNESVGVITFLGLGAIPLTYNSGVVGMTASINITEYSRNADA